MQVQSYSRLTYIQHQRQVHSLTGIRIDYIDNRQPLPLLSSKVAQTCDNMPWSHHVSAHPLTPSLSPLQEPSAATYIGPFALHLGSMTGT